MEHLRLHQNVDSVGAWQEIAEARGQLAAVGTSAFIEPLVEGNAPHAAQGARLGTRLCVGP